MSGNFFIYPGQPAELAKTARSALRVIQDEFRKGDVFAWEDPGIPGAFVVDPALEQADGCDLLVADLTRLTFNILYRVGQAIGRGQRLLLTKNSTVAGEDHVSREVGLFDSLGPKDYQDARQLANLLADGQDAKAFVAPETKVNHKSPVYILLPRAKTELEIHLLSRVKKAKLFFRSFDPEEQGRLSIYEAVKNIAMSYGVIVPLLPASRPGGSMHNLRAAFAAGIAAALGKELLLLQFGDDPVPVDYGGFVRRVMTEPQIDGHIAEFAPAITACLQSASPPVVTEPKGFLAKLNLGATAAENEMSDLADYYLETDEYRRTSRGEVQIVAGRKGSGKTALFVRLRDNLRRNRQTVVLDLMPEGFQLLKFKDLVLAYLEQGTREHTITAFWEYLLLLEICHKILEKDKDFHLTNHKLTGPYREMSEEYKGDSYVSEGDFAERMLKLTERIMDDFQEVIGLGDRQTRLTTGELTNILYKHDTKILRKRIAAYLEHKRAVWILFDNVDKGWPPRGLKSEDVLILRCLVEAVGKLEKSLRKWSVEGHGVDFLRNDVYELLVENTTDRGKTSRVLLDWWDPELLRELLRRRLVTNGLKPDTRFDAIWGQICVSHVGTEESSSYLIDRSLMRPRSLLDLLHHCRSHAVNLGHSKIELDDIRDGEAAYSSDLVATISLEIRDVFPAALDILYEFVGLPVRQKGAEITGLLGKAGVEEGRRDEFLDLLLWYGFLGVVRDDGDVSYIYSVKYDMKHLKALVKKQGPAAVHYHINPAFWAGLEITH